MSNFCTSLNHRLFLHTPFISLIGLAITLFACSDEMISEESETSREEYIENQNFLVPSSCSSSLSTSFHGDGKRYVLEPSDFHYAYPSKHTVQDVLTYPNASYVLTTKDNNQSALIKLSSNGYLSTSFASNGYLELPNIQATKMAFDNYGNIIIAGNDNSSFKTIKISANGALISTNTYTNSHISPKLSSRVNDIKIDTSNRLYILGTVFYLSSASFSLMRINPDNTLDTSFSTDGRVALTFPSSSNNVASSMTLDIYPNGYDIYVAGTAYPNGAPQMAIAKLNQNGTLNTSYDSDGKVYLSSSTSSSSTYGVYIDVDESGKLYLGAQIEYGIVKSLGVARFDWNVPHPSSSYGSGSTQYLTELSVGPLTSYPPNPSYSNYKGYEFLRENGEMWLVGSVYENINNQSKQKIVYGLIPEDGSTFLKAGTIDYSDAIGSEGVTLNRGKTLNSSLQVIDSNLLYIGGKSHINSSEDRGNISVVSPSCQ